MHSDDEEKYAFCSTGGFWQFNVMCCLDCVKYLMETVLRDLMRKICLVHMDDVNIFDRIPEEHIKYDSVDCFSPTARRSLTQTFFERIFEKNFRYMGIIALASGLYLASVRCSLIPTKNVPTTLNIFSKYLKYIGKYVKLLAFQFLL